MRITQIYNNNVIGALDEKGREVIVLGRGVGYKTRVGKRIPETAIEKIFTLNPKNKDKFKQLVEDIPYEHIQISDEIIRMAKETLGKRLSENVYITLTDHVNFAIERYKEGIPLHNAMLWEIRSFYPDEFKAGEKAIALINSRMGVELGEDEAGFIALHFVNAVLDISMRSVSDITDLIRATLEIVSRHFAMPIDEDSLSFRRFTMHLRYLGQRVLNQRESKHAELELDVMVRAKYPDDYACAQSVAEYIKARYGVTITNDDKTFLAVHIMRLTASRKGK